MVKIRVLKVKPGGSMLKTSYIETPINSEIPSIFTDDMLHINRHFKKRSDRLSYSVWRQKPSKIFRPHSYISYRPRHSLNHQQWSFK